MKLQKNGVAICHSAAAPYAGKPRASICHKAVIAVDSCGFPTRGAAAEWHVWKGFNAGFSLRIADWKMVMG